LSSLRGDPDGGEDHGHDAYDPGYEALGDGTDPAQGEPARVLLLAHLDDVGDHVTLLLGRDGRVVEDRHRLRPGEHRLVDLSGGGRVQAGRVLAARQRAARARPVVTLDAVGAEQLTTLGGVAERRVDLLAGR